MADAQQVEAAAGVLRAARRVVVFTGAGVSADSGLATFRGPGGMWRGRDAMALATPEAFAADPEIVWEFYNERRRLAFTAEPNAGHRAIADLARLPRFEAVDVVTQNVDRLHRWAGSDDAIELHGNLDETRCSSCGRVEDRAGEALDDLPTCDACGGLLRPNVVWFGESLPTDAMARAKAAARGCDAMLVVGTSRQVYPAAGLVDVASEAGAAVVVVDPHAGPRAGEVAVLPALVERLRYGPSGSLETPRRPR